MREQPFHPDLRLARYLPRSPVGPRTLWLLRRLARFAPHARSGVSMSSIGDDVAVRMIRPGSDRHPAPTLLWIHGGGYVMGTAAQDDQFSGHFVDELDINVAAVEYRLAPEHPYPTPLEDCYTALCWLAEHPDVDASRIAIGGASAGGGLAAALALLARERGEVEPVLQLLSYPMLDDRTAARTDIDERNLRLWDQKSNRFGWASYLGSHSGDSVPPLAAPARHDDLAGLPPAWIGVGTLDLFYEENLAYARRLEEAGVPCQLHVVEGAYHGFDGVERDAQVSREFLRSRVDALRDAIGDDAG